MENELQVFITNLDKKYIKNDKTDEVKNYCMVTYLIPKDNTQRSKGCAQLSCYCNESAFDDLEKYMYKWSKAVVKSIADESKNRIKLKIVSVNDVVVS